MICQFCHKEYKSNINGAFSIHLRKIHNISDEEYYIKYIMKPNEGKCKKCGKLAVFISLDKGFKKYCKEHIKKPKSTTFIKCQICNKKFSSLSIPSHLRIHNINTKQYYDIYCKKSNNICKICGKETKFINIVTGYAEYCSISCAQSSEQIQQKIKATNLIKYGSENIFQSNYFKETAKQTSLEHFGTEYPTQSNKIQEKIQNTCLLKYGTTNGGASKEAQEKIRKTTKEHKEIDNRLDENNL